ncbi:MAG TPA: TetR/AcrR family transcriptional regulator [Humidesulfovibrio sp.]|uniref:TetR/AcrR family transcriptional regulator n=1 Tax=Humidesulfovibrio sp. TaxID=2910988 RepID=UPI002C706895|nr:TetR/AcrR family transcriptional regulator [Humidesulfovibrio sp.]HWR05093.1 TetR/AcrR family transcriptional regulator [Humidesulfovibrio sp.]
MNNRRALLDAAKSLIAAKGVKATTIAGIAARAGVAKGLLFYYFKDKGSVVQAIAEELDAEYMAALPSTGESAPAIERLHALIRHHFDFLEQAPESAQFLYQSAAADRGEPVAGFYGHLHARILAILEQGVAAGEFRADDVEELAYMLLGSLHGVGRLKLFEFKRDYDAARHLAAFYDKVLLRPRAGGEHGDS